MNEPAVVITGASTGIGRACALQLDSEGFRVFAGVRNEADAERLRKEGSERLRPIQLDVTDSGSIAAAVETVGKAVHDSRLLGLVNNAGIAVAGPLEFIPLDALRHQLEVNLVGQVAVTQAFLPLLRESRGRIAFVSSVAGRFPQPFVGPYCASKHALEAVADALRVELRPWDIEVSLIEPGAVATPIWDKSNGVAQTMVAAASPRLRELYGAALQVMGAISAREKEKGVPPQRVAVAVADALTANRPKTRYVVGREAKMMLLLKRLLTDRQRDAVILRVTGLPSRESEASAADSASVSVGRPSRSTAR